MKESQRWVRTAAHAGRLWQVILAGLLLSCWLGCRQAAQAPEESGATPNPTNNSVAPADTLTATAILSQMQQAYRQAEGYQDQGMLHLNYRLQGQPLKEPKRWSTRFASGGQLAAEIFNTQLVSDGQRLACRVFDIESANLNGQWLVLPYRPAQPLLALLEDPIAEHFVAGFSELPLDEQRKQRGPWLLPPPLLLRTGQAGCPWVTQPDQLQRLPDELLDEEPCFVLRSLAEDMTADLWIRKSDFLLLQMSLPLKLLAGEVVTSTEVDEVELVARFAGAAAGAAPDPASFRVQTPPQSTPVVRFITLPAPLPSSSIGQSVENLRLMTPAGNLRAPETFAGKVQALVFLGGPPTYEVIPEIGKLAGQLPAEAAISVVFSDVDRRDPAQAAPQPNAELAQAAEAAQLPLLYDPLQSTGNSLGLEAVPAVVVCDPQVQVQYVANLSGDRWTEDLVAAIERVVAGDDLASEMLAEHQRYLEAYDQQLAAVRHPDFSANGAPGNAVPTCTWTLAWTCDQLQRPGNLIAWPADTGQAASLAVFDGWQSLVFLGSDGTVQQRVALPLGQQQAATQLRRVTLSRGAGLAVFGDFGDRIQILNDQGREIAQFPDPDRSLQIRDCQVSDLNGDDQMELLVATVNQGLFLVDPNTGQAHELHASSADALGAIGNQVLLLNQGQVNELKSGTKVAATGDLTLSGLQTFNPDSWLAVGRDGQGQDLAVGVSPTGERSWTVPVGPQLFENSLAPIAHAQRRDGTLLWAVADARQGVSLVTGNGRWLGRWSGTSPIQGMGLLPLEDKLALIVALEERIECWTLDW